MRHTASALFALLIAASVAAADDAKVFSGPQPGEKLTDFNVRFVYGPNAGKPARWAGARKDTPGLLVFVHEITRPAMQLLRPVDAHAAKLAADGHLHTTLVWLSADAMKTEEYLNRAKQSLNLKSPVAISLDGLEGPGNYGLNRKAMLTILVFKGGKVTANFAIIQPNETDAPKVLAALAQVTGTKAPTLDELRGKSGKIRKVERPAAGGGDAARLQQTLLNELTQLRQQLAVLTNALNEARAKIAKLESKPAPAPLPVPKAVAPKRPAAGQEGRPSASPELQSLMRRMIQKDNDEETVRRIADEMTRWAGADAGRRAELAGYCRLVVRLGYGAPAAQQALRKLAGQ